MTIRRLHPSLRVTRTLSGRPATSGFPVLGLPKKSQEGRRIRSLVRAPKGYVIGSWDYSQIELRIASKLSGDRNLQNAYIAGKDIHTQTAELIFGLPKEKQDEGLHRTPAKAGNFGYWMGMEAKGLTEAIHKEGILSWSAGCPGCKSWRSEHWPNCDSVKFFAGFDKAYPGARAYQLQRREHVRQTGFAYGLWGERWYLPGAWSPHEDVREATERQAFALPIQSGNARLIKQAGRRIYYEDMPWAKKQGFDVQPLLWIHDEFLFLVEEAAILPWHRRVKATMETVTDKLAPVPIVAEGSYGPSWLEKQKIDK